MGSMNIFVTVLVSVVVVGALVAGLRVTGGRGPSKVRAGQPACDVERGLGRRRWRLRRLVVGGRLRQRRLRRALLRRRLVVRGRRGRLRRGWRLTGPPPHGHRK